MRDSCTAIAESSNEQAIEYAPSALAEAYRAMATVVRNWAPLTTPWSTSDRRCCATAARKGCVQSRFPGRAAPAAPTCAIIAARSRTVKETGPSVRISSSAGSSLLKPRSNVPYLLNATGSRSAFGRGSIGGRSRVGAGARVSSVVEVIAIASRTLVKWCMGSSGEQDRAPAAQHTSLTGRSPRPQSIKSPDKPDGITASMEHR
jgi:hypothetical protein